MIRVVRVDKTCDYYYLPKRSCDILEKVSVEKVSIINRGYQGLIKNVTLNAELQNDDESSL